MASFLVILFFITLIYVALSEHVKTYINLIALQGFLLFGIAIIELHNFDFLNLSFVLLETLIFKAIVVPWFMARITQRLHLHRITHKHVRGFNSMLAISVIIALSFIFSYYLNDEHLRTNYFAAALSSIIGGIVFIIMNKNIAAHLISYLILENGIFLLALAVGGEMPMLINTAILMDIVTSVLVLGVFLNKIGARFRDVDIDKLTELKD